jgi:hypothetical protein
LAQIPDKDQKSLLNNFLISLCFACSEYWLQFTSVENQEKQNSSENWLAGLTFFLFVLTYHTCWIHKQKNDLWIFPEPVRMLNKATFLEQKGTKTRTMIFFRLLNFHCRSSLKQKQSRRERQTLNHASGFSTFPKTKHKKFR